MSSGVYVIECNGRQYVGSAQDISSRWAVHRCDLRKGRHHSRYLQRAYNKYGEVALAFSVLEYCEVDQCITREQYWIDALHPAYNMHSLARSPLGVKRGEATRAKLRAIGMKRNPPMLGKNHTEETRAKMRGRVVSEETRAKLRDRVISEETRAKLSAAKKGKPRPRVAVEKGAAALRGRKRPPEVVEKWRQKLIGVKHSEERRAKNSASHKGQVIPPEQRAKISASLKGRPSPNRGKTLSKEQRAKISASLRAYNARKREQA